MEEVKGSLRTWPALVDRDCFHIWSVRASAWEAQAKKSLQEVAEWEFFLKNDDEKKMGEKIFFLK